MRVAIIGNSGSGKSTLARQLSARYSLTSLDLDTVAWKSGTIGVPRSEAAAAAELTAFCTTHERWAIEGCYAGLVRCALDYFPILVFIDPGVEACVANCRLRPWEPHKYASADEQNEKLEFLLTWVREYYTRDGDLSFAAHRALFDAYGGPKHMLTHQAEPAFVEWLSSRRYADGIDDLGARFEACAIAKEEWTHTAHLVVGLWHVHRYGAEEALARLRTGIRRLNESLGGVNSATGGYHETITAAYVELLSRFLASCSREARLADCVAALLESPLASKDVLLRFYSRDLLMSTTARAGWVEPDLAPLSVLDAATP